VATACGGNSGEDGQFAELVEQAKTHYGNKDLLSAREVYEKALETKEDSEVRSALRELNNEIEKTREFNQLIDSLREAQRGAKASLSVAEIKKQGVIVDDVIMALDNYEYVGDYYVNRYIKKARDSAEYVSLGLAGMSAKIPEVVKEFTVTESANDLIEAVDALMSKIEYPDILRSVK